MNKIIIVIAMSYVFGVATVNAQTNENEAILSNAANKFFVLSYQEKWEEAKPFVQEAYELGQSLYSEFDPLFGPIAHRYGAVQIALKDPNAILALTQATNNFKQNLNDDPLPLIQALRDLSSAHLLSGNIDEAEKNIDQAISLAANEFSDDSTMVADICSRAGKEFSDSGEFGLAYKLQDRAYDIFFSVLGASSKKTGEVAYQISETLRKNQNLLGQVSFLKKATKSFDQPTSAETAFQLTIHKNLVKAYHNLKKEKNATAHVLALAKSSIYREQAEPTVLVKENARYRGRSKESQMNGFVSLNFDVDSNGYVKNIELQQFEGDRKLIKLATDALKGYRYIPVISNDEPMGTKGMETKIVFKWDT